VAGDRDWRAAVDIGSLSAEARRALLDAVRAKLGGVGASRAVGLSRAALYRYLSGERAVPAPQPTRTAQVEPGEEILAPPRLLRMDRITSSSPSSASTREARARCEPTTALTAPSLLPGSIHERGSRLPWLSGPDPDAGTELKPREMIASQI